MRMNIIQSLHFIVRLQSIYPPVRLDVDLFCPSGGLYCLLLLSVPLVGQHAHCCLLPHLHPVQLPRSMDGREVRTQTTRELVVVFDFYKITTV